jgi:Domain of unknown function (DUF4956)
MIVTYAQLAELLQAPIGLFPRLLIDLAALVGIVWGGYRRGGGRGSHLLTLVTFNVVIFVVTHLLNEVEMTMGAAFGLFAVFSLLRYRTEGISSRDMTYLFLVIALGLVTAVGAGRVSGLLAIALSLTAMTWIFESGWLTGHERSHVLIYDDVRLLGTDARDRLIADLRERTGLPVQRVEVEEIDLLRDVARLTIYYSAS